MGWLRCTPHLKGWMQGVFYEPHPLIRNGKLTRSNLKRVSKTFRRGVEEPDFREGAASAVRLRVAWREKAQSFRTTCCAESLSSENMLWPGAWQSEPEDDIYRRVGSWVFPMVFHAPKCHWLHQFTLSLTWIRFKSRKPRKVMSLMTTAKFAPRPPPHFPQTN